MIFAILWIAIGIIATSLIFLAWYVGVYMDRNLPLDEQVPTIAKYILTIICTCLTIISWLPFIGWLIKE